MVYHGKAAAPSSAAASDLKSAMNSVIVCFSFPFPSIVSHSLLLSLSISHSLSLSSLSPLLHISINLNTGILPLVKCLHPCTFPACITQSKNKKGTPSGLAITTDDVLITPKKGGDELYKCKPSDIKLALEVRTHSLFVHPTCWLHSERWL